MNIQAVAPAEYIRKKTVIMGDLPVPAAMFFDDFASGILEYNVLDDDVLIATYHGMANSDEDGDYIGFLMSDQPKISAGNTIKTSDGLETFKIIQISYDRYNGKAELLKAYY